VRIRLEPRPVTAASSTFPETPDPDHGDVIFALSTQHNHVHKKEEWRRTTHHGKATRHSCKLKPSSAMFDGYGLANTGAPTSAFGKNTPFGLNAAAHGRSSSSPMMRDTPDSTPSSHTEVGQPTCSAHIQLNRIPGSPPASRRAAAPKHGAEPTWN